PTPRGKKAQRAAAPMLGAHRQARRHEGGALSPCKTFHPPPLTAAHFAHPPRQAHSRHPAQDRRQRGTRGGIRLATLTCRSDPLAAAAPARLEAVFLPRSGGGVHRQGIKRELTRRSAIEAVIGHMKAEGHLGRCYLKGRAGDAANVILSAVGYNLRLVLAWLRIILRVILLALLQTFTIRPALKPAS